MAIEWDEEADAVFSDVESDEPVPNSVSNLDSTQDFDSSSSNSDSSESCDDVKATKKPSSSIHNPLSVNDDSERSKDNHNKSTVTKTNKSAELYKGVHGPTNLEDSKQSTAVGSAHDRRARRNVV